MQDVIRDLYDIICDRKQNKIDGSYTCYLFDKGIDKILKKCAEECGETIIAAKNGDKTETVNEICDLTFHLMVLMSNEDINLDDVKSELEKRREKQKNLKQFHKVDKDS